MRLVWLFLVALAPAASAAQLTFGAAVVDGVPVPVNGGGAEVTVPALYHCDPTDAALQGATLRLDPPTMPNGTVLSGAFSYPIPAEACQGPLSKDWHQDLKFQLTASPAARGETPLAVQLRGAVVDNGGMMGNGAPSNAAEAAIPFSVRYLGQVTAHVSAPIGQAPPGGSIRYEVTVVNLGNANTNVDFALDGEAPDGWLAIAPASVVVGPSHQSGGSDFQRTVTFEVRAPTAPTNRSQEFGLRILAGSTVAPEQRASPVEVHFLARVLGCPSTGCPITDGAGSAGKVAPAGPVALLAVLGCAVVAHRRTR